MIRRPLSYSLALCLPVALAACHKDDGGSNGAPVDPAAMSQQAADRIADMVHSTAAAMQANRALSGATSDAGSGVSTMVRVFRLSSSDSPTPVGGPGTPGAAQTDTPATGTTAAEPNWGELTLAGVERLAGVLAGNRRQQSPAAADGVVLTAATSDASGSSDLADQIDMQADDLHKLIHDRLLADTNLESKSDAEAIYLLHPDPTCRSLKDDTLDPKCADDLTKLQVRLRLTRHGEGAQVEVLFGPSRLHPLSVIVDPNRIALDLYLAPLKDTILFASAALGEKTPDLPATMKGTIESSLSKEAAKRVTVALSVLEDIEFSDGSVTVRTAATQPALSFTADGDARSITGKVNIAKTEVIVPWSPTARVMGAQADIVLGGLTGETTFTDQDKRIVLTRLGLGGGPSYLDVLEGGAQKRIVQADLNPMDGRSFDLAITFDAQNQPRITLTPRVDFSLMCHLDLVKSDFDEAPPAFLLDETYRLQLDPAGGGSSVVLGPYQSTVAGEEGGIRVVSGSFSLGSSKVAMPVTASAGQCIVGVEPPPGSHPLLGGLKVVACP